MPQHEPPCEVFRSRGRSVDVCRRRVNKGGRRTKSLPARPQEWLRQLCEPCGPPATSLRAQLRATGLPLLVKEHVKLAFAVSRPSRHRGHYQSLWATTHREAALLAGPMLAWRTASSRAINDYFWQIYEVRRLMAVRKKAVLEANVLTLRVWAANELGLTLLEAEKSPAHVLRRALARDDQPGDGLCLRGVPSFMFRGRLGDRMDGLSVYMRERGTVATPYDRADATCVDVIEGEVLEWICHGGPRRLSELAHQGLISVKIGAAWRGPDK